MMFYVQKLKACGYHVLPPSVDTGHLPNLFIKDAIIKRSATSIVLPEDRQIDQSEVFAYVLAQLIATQSQIYIENQPTLI